MARIQHKRGTSANLASVNPTPLAGELIYDSTENAIKMGDGTTAYTSLAYVTATPRSHNHDDRYYTETEVDGLLASKVADNDARLSDARTPTAHKDSHATGGSDALTPADIGAAPAASPTFTGTVTSTGVILADDLATANSVAYAFDGDPNTGIGRGGADILTVVTGGAERVRVGSDGKPTFSYVATTAMPSTVSEVLAAAATTVFNTSDTATHSGVVLRTRTTGSAVAMVGLEYKTTFSDGEVFVKIRNGSGTTIEPLRVKYTGAVRFVPLASDPAGGEAGDVYYNSANNKLRVYNGTSWVDLH